MAVRIRLSRIGRKKTPFYSLVAIDSKSKRDGAFLSDIGTYDSLKGKIVVFREELYKDWVSKGAIPSDSAKKVYRIYKRGLKAAQENVLGADAKTKATVAKLAAKSAEKKSATEKSASVEE